MESFSQESSKININDKLSKLNKKILAVREKELKYMDLAREATRANNQPMAKTHLLAAKMAKTE